MTHHSNSLQRTLTALSHKEPDKVPLFLLLSVTGAKFNQSSIEDYFTDAEAVAEAQLTMLERYQHDSLYAFYYASAEIEAFGGDTLFFLTAPLMPVLPLFIMPEILTIYSFQYLKKSLYYREY